jgi:hypothetical protein
MMGVTFLIVKLNVIVLNVVMLAVVAPTKRLFFVSFSAIFFFEKKKV